VAVTGPLRVGERVREPLARPCTAPGEIFLFDTLEHAARAVVVERIAAHETFSDHMSLQPVDESQRRTHAISRISATGAMR
jgi:uncharacterized protein YwlG (UPF0340 family)